MVNKPDYKQEYLKSGINFQKEGRYDSALKEFERMLEIEPENEIAHLEIGKTYKMMNRCQEAIKKFVHLIRINPNNREAIIELGETSRLNEDYQLAIEEVQEVIKKSPANEQAYIELSKIFLKNSDYESSFRQLNKALEINKANSEIYLCLGKAYWAKGEKEEAISSIKKAIEIDPNNRHAHGELGDIYRQEKNYPVATNEIETAIKLGPLDIQQRFKLIQLYNLQNKFDLFEKEAREILKFKPEDSFFQDSMLNEIEILQKKTVLKSRVKRLWVTVTSRCNIRCRTCGLWSSPWDIPRKTIDEVIAYYPYLERVVWLGGEVFLYKDFEELFQKGLAFPNLRQQIITNGVILTRDWIEKIMRANAELTISVDGVTKEVYEYIRTGSSFEKLISNIKLVNELRQKYSSQTKMRLNAVIMKSNYHQLEDFLDFANEFGFCQVSLMALHFDQDPQENILYSNVDRKVLEYITNTIPKIRQKAKLYNVDLDILLPTLNPEPPKPECNNNIESSIPKEEALYCKMPWKYMFICDKGTVYLTGSCIKAIGNVHQNSLDEIWNSQEAQSYREGMIRNQFEGICRPECRTRWEA